MMNSLYLKLGALAATFAGGFWLNGVMWQGKWSERDKADALAAVAAQEAERAKERQWQEDIQRVHEDGKKQQEVIAADAAELSNVVARLRKQIADRSANSKGANSAATDISRAAATDKVMYSVMLEALVIRAEQYAGFADESRAAGLTCQAAYESIRRNAGVER